MFKESGLLTYHTHELWSVFETEPVVSAPITASPKKSLTDRRMSSEMVMPCTTCQRYLELWPYCMKRVEPLLVNLLQWIILNLFLPEVQQENQVNAVFQKVGTPYHWGEVVCGFVSITWHQLALPWSANYLIFKFSQTDSIWLLSLRFCMKWWFYTAFQRYWWSFFSDISKFIYS